MEICVKNFLLNFLKFNFESYCGRWAGLEKVVQEQAARIAELEKRLNKNSSNSSKPPSSDGLGKPPRTTSLRENGKRNSGGQKGHKGKTLKQIESPDTMWIGWFILKFVRVSSWLLSAKSKSKVGLEKRSRI